MIVAPPFEAGGLNAIEACPLPGVTEVTVGVPGTVAGAIEFDGDDAGPVPAALVAVTENVYAVPFDRPVTTIGEDVPVAVRPPGDEVAV